MAHESPQIGTLYGGKQTGQSGGAAGRTIYKQARDIPGEKLPCEGIEATEAPFIVPKVLWSVELVLIWGPWSDRDCTALEVRIRLCVFNITSRFVQEKKFWAFGCSPSVCRSCIKMRLILTCSVRLMKAQRVRGYFLRGKRRRGCV